jgi:hypothetical protein
VSSVTGEELPGTVPAGSSEAGGWEAGALGERSGGGSVSFCNEPGKVSSVLGTTTAGELLEARPMRLAALGVADAGSMMPPPISATAGIAEPILRKGNLIVCT